VTPAESDHLALVERIYGFNWASVGGRERGLDDLAEMMAPDFESRLSDEVGGRTVIGITGLRDFGRALEQDFSELRYEPLDFRSAPDGRVVVTGRILGVGRSSRLPLSGTFGHIWTLADGKAVAVRAHLDSQAALEAAGLA
jgi:ketosteroid isomerase-like protein